MKRLRPFLLAIGLVLLALAPLGQGNYITFILTSWLVYTIAAMGLNLTLGYSGQISLAQASFMGIGAYVTALMTLAGVPWLLAMPCAVLASFVVGLILGFPALRVQGHFLAFVTLAFNTLFFLVARNEDWLTGGNYGLSSMPRPDFHLFGLQILNTGKNLPFYYFALVVFVIAASILWWIVHSPWGRAFKGLRENPIRAESLGVDTTRLTLLAFAIGSAYAGLAGAMVSPLVQYIDPNSFNLTISLKILLMVVVGGSGYFYGPLLGAAIVILLPEELRVLKNDYLIVYASTVIVLMIVSPRGLMGLGERIYAWITKPGTETRKDMDQGAQL